MPLFFVNEVFRQFYSADFRYTFPLNPPFQNKDSVYIGAWNC